MKRPTDIAIKRVLNERASQKEAVEVAAWLATDKGQAWLSGEMDADADEFAKGTVPLLEGIPTEELLRRIDRIIDRAKRRRLLFRAAALLIPCALILGMWFNMNSRLGGMLFSTPEMEETASQRGERREIIFQDGSKVFLNAGTTISYPQHFGLAERRVVLDGEAYFEVTPNARRPFVVEIGKAAVKVLGTSFNVKAYDTEPKVDVVLIEGKVEFSHGKQQFMMAPSQRLVFDKADGTVEIFDEEQADRSALWRKNMLSFRDAPLQEVITTLERWYDVQFDVRDDAAYKSTFSLQTPQLPLPELLGEMQNISDVRFEIDKNLVRVHMKK